MTNDIPDARITGFQSRERLKLRKPESFSTNIDPDGVTLHHGGEGLAIPNHAKCVSAWKSWQDFHMDERKWADIAYTHGFCQHGYVLEGRGYGLRTAANGSDSGNLRSYAFCHINEKGRLLTPEARSAAAWLVNDARLHGAGSLVWPHHYWYQTDCPGPELTALARLLDQRPIGIGRTGPSPIIEGDVMSQAPTVREIQSGLLYYPLDPNHVNPLTLLTRTYDEVMRISEGLHRSREEVSDEIEVILRQVPELQGADIDPLVDKLVNLVSLLTE